MNVSDLMSAPTRTCRPGDPLTSVARTLWEQDLGMVPVVDEAGRVVAAVTDRDLCMGAYTQGKSLADLHVRDCMSGVVTTCREQDSVEDALATMARARVRRLPVVDSSGRPAGMLTLADVTRALAAADGGGAALVQPVLQALLAVTTPHGQETPEAVVELKPARRAPARKKKAAPAAAATAEAPAQKPAEKPAPKQADKPAAKTTEPARTAAPAKETPRAGAAARPTAPTGRKGSQRKKR